MRPPRRGPGDPAEICAPALPAVPRPYALAPSLALHSRTARTQAPRHAVPVRLRSHRPESGPLRRMRCLQGPGQGYPPRGGRALSDGPLGGDTSRFLFSSLQRERRGQAPRRSGGGSQIGISLLAAPLPPPCRPAVGRAPTYPGPSSSLECCKKQARSRGRSWGQASTGPRDEPTSLVLVWDCEGILRTPS